MTAHVDTKAARSGFGQIWRYGVTGIANTALGYGLTLACVYALGASILVANIVGYSAGWCLSYALNKRWTFAHRGALGRTALLFAGLVALAFTGNVLLTYALVGAGLAYPVAQILGAASYSIAVFAGLKWMVFAS
ncbi:MAG: GtrA family protein [Pseudomonadota bacterium]